MISRALFFSAVFFWFTHSLLEAQISSFPFVENFDTVAVPRLPAGWLTSVRKLPSGDFSTSASTPFSEPNAVVSTDAKIAQSLTSPPINFSGKIAGTLEFYERRTSSHNSGLLVEALVNNDTASAVQIGDTLKNTGTTNYVERDLALPPSLSGEHDVRFRWRVAGNGTGATGTLRIDNVKISVQKVLDLALTGIRFEPANVREGENIIVYVSVANRALSGSVSFTLQLFDDKNSDSPATAEEKVGEQPVTHFFNAADSAVFAFTDPVISPGSHRFLVRLLLTGDEDSTNNTLSGTIFVGYSPRSILVNEIMYAPSTGPEWVECINNSIDTISLSQWKVGDNTSSRAPMSTQSPRIVPSQYFIIARDSSILNYYPSIHVPIINATLPTLNNDFDAVEIVDPTGFTIDSVAYNSSWGGTGGKSLERIDTAAASNQPGNWGSSRNPMGATPGAVNSLSKKDYDLSVEKIFPSVSFPVAGQPFEISAMIKNIGRQPISNISVQFFFDANNDSIPQSNELVAEQHLNILSPADSQVISYSLNVASQGEQRVFVGVKSQRDDDSTNNMQALSFDVGVAQHSIVVNEIMYAPPGNMPEWIEFYNTSDSAIDIGGWKISGANAKSKAVIVGSQFFIQPGTYFLAASDSTLRDYFSISSRVFVVSFSSLNNTTPDAVVLYDDRGVTMDSVWYKPSWGGTRGTSLERIDYYSSSVDSANWKSSVPSPGYENHDAKKDFDVAVTEASATLVSGGLRMTASIRNVGRNTASGFSVRFYHDANGDSAASPEELLQSINAASLSSGDSMTVQYDWQTTLHGMIPIICAVDFSQDQRTSNNTFLVQAENKFDPQSVVVNEIMYDPLPNRSEFIELFNRSIDTVNLQGWTVMDAPSSSGSRSSIKISNTPFFMPPSSYVVISADSTIILQFPSLLYLSTGKLVVANKDLSLNNSGDDVVLADLTNTQIDSVRYSPSWHNPSLNTPTTGRSLERVNPSLGSNDRRNWSSSVAPGGATPGQRNSIFTTSVPSAAHLTLSPNPFSPDNDGFEDFLAIQYSLPSATSMIRVRCFDVQGRLVRTLVNNEPAASSGTVIWNGLDDNNRRVRIGMYIIVFEALDSSGGVVHTMKDVAVVATKLK
ncbi:MAG: lamin tail domain-containing protein [Bacteroidota bacterium]